MKLHIYAQLLWHGEAFIVGTPAALRALRDTCDLALEGKTQAVTSFAADGEGYNVFVVPLEESDPRWEQLVLPYTDEMLGSMEKRLGNEGAIGPIDVLGSDEYVKLTRALQR